jgi:tRNA A37 threonylcarbamoyladenosine synthetase subunit TsaC/SUA5/YrdC
MQQYLQAWAAQGSGALVSTSLNISGMAPVYEAEQIPAGIPALTLPNALAGTVSRIYDPLADIWLR